MLPGGRMLAVGAVVALSTASVGVAASTSIDSAATAHTPAQRLDPSSGAALAPAPTAVTEVIAIVDVERARRGLPSLTPDDRATAAAQVHAADMAAMQRMQHVGSDGSDGGDRLTRAGFVWSTWGENIGAGFHDPHVLVDAWMSSPSHRANLLGRFRFVGVGLAYSADGVPYWSLVVADAPL